MKLTKEALKQLIKEEIEKTGVASGKVTPKTQGSLTAQAIEKTKQAFRDGDTAEDQLLVKIIDMIGSAAKKQSLGTDSKLLRILGMIEKHINNRNKQ
tara:strand:+ start:1620 stop:1910 length:291 start_codon:yes stop_codon:yes gene_type:complete